MRTVVAAAVADQEKVAYVNGPLLEGSDLKMGQMRQGCKANIVVVAGGVDVAAVGD